MRSGFVDRAWRLAGVRGRVMVAAIEIAGDSSARLIWCRARSAATRLRAAAPGGQRRPTPRRPDNRDQHRSGQRSRGTSPQFHRPRGSRARTRALNRRCARPGYRSSSSAVTTTLRLAGDARSIACAAAACAPRLLPRRHPACGGDGGHRGRDRRRRKCRRPGPAHRRRTAPRQRRARQTRCSPIRPCGAGGSTRCRPHGRRPTRPAVRSGGSTHLSCTRRRRPARSHCSSPSSSSASSQHQRASVRSALRQASLPTGAGDRCSDVSASAGRRGRSRAHRSRAARPPRVQGRAVDGSREQAVWTGAAPRTPARPAAAAVASGAPVGPAHTTMCGGRSSSIRRQEARLRTQRRPRTRIVRITPSTVASIQPSAIVDAAGIAAAPPNSIAIGWSVDGADAPAAATTRQQPQHRHHRSRR